jgi:hypothetical protein
VNCFLIQRLCSSAILWEHIDLTIIEEKKLINISVFVVIIVDDNAISKTGQFTACNINYFMMGVNDNASYIYILYSVAVTLQLIYRCIVN